jgi:cytochrome b561
MKIDTADPPRYGAITQLLHWISAILVVTAFIYGPGGSEERVYSAAREFDRQLHETLGLSVLAIVVLRLFWRSIAEHRDPVGIPLWMKFASKALQASLYGLLLALPVTAIAGAWLEGHALTLLGGLQIAPPVTASHGIGATLAIVHSWLGDVVMWLAGAHAAAALYHHFVLRDGVLLSMLPKPFRRNADRA